MAASAVLEKIKAENIRFIDLRFTDPCGKWHHITMDADIMDKAALEEGVMFDASSISGWRAINDSDMVLRPDLASACMDPFFAEPSLALVCDVIDPVSGAAYNRDPRAIARRCEAYVKGFGDVIYVGPEAEFFVFDDVRFKADAYSSFYYLDSDELPANSGREYEMGNFGHRPPLKGGYVPLPPVDSAQDMRSEMLLMLKNMGVVVEKHHHEVAPAQHELGIKFDSLLRQADKMQIFKYAVRQVANAYGKTASFMPKPVLGDNGSGMHVHLSLWKGDKALFAGDKDKYAGLSDMCLHFIGGIIRHARALNAFANPTTNSYKRLVPGFEAPVLLAYSARNRSASCRIPHVFSAKSRRVEVRFPDPAANPYLAFSALVMAGLDGIKRKINPGEAMDKDLYELPPAELEKIPTVSASLAEALDALDKDRAFLKEGGVFDDDMLDAYIALKQQEVRRCAMTPTPVEFDMYYSV